MESLSETEWDVIISGTGLQQSLLALALSRSGKKILHLDRNQYYGDAEAAFSLQEVEEWLTKVNAGTLDPFSNASIWKSDDHSPANPGAEKLSFSRAYTLSLSPQIIYSRSKLLTQLVSSKVYRHLEFQAVGSWWIYHVERLSGEPVGSLLAAELKRIPNGREDVTFDKSIDLRAKRKLMMFLNFVVDYKNQSEIWEEYADSPLEEFMSARFQIPERLQTVALALTLSLDLPSKTIVRYSLPRIARHLSSIGVFGPGFGAVLPKWGGSSEIAQVACRAGAVGGTVYVLGTGVARREAVTSSRIEVELTSKETVRTKLLVQPSKPLSESQTLAASSVSKMIAVISSDLASLFVSAVEGGPTPAVSVVVFPSNSLLVNAEPQPYPVYIMAHSSDTGECPIGQCLLYASTLTSRTAKLHLEAATAALISSYHTTQNQQDSTAAATAQARAGVLFSVYYEQAYSECDNGISDGIISLARPSADLAFNDTMLDNVEVAWGAVTGLGEQGGQGGEHDGYMSFADREPLDAAEGY